MGDTEVAGQSPGDDEQQPPTAEASQEPDPQAEPGAPDTTGAEPISKPDNKFHG
jgi:hypothetical protein